MNNLTDADLNHQQLSNYNLHYHHNDQQKNDNNNNCTNRFFHHQSMAKNNIAK